MATRPLTKAQKAKIRRTFYKIVTAEGRSPSISHYRWSRPRGTTPGKWHRVEGKLRACGNGLHVVKYTQARYWWNRWDLFQSLTLYACQVREAKRSRGPITGSSKYYCRAVRLVRKVRRFSPEWHMLMEGR